LDTIRKWSELIRYVQRYILESLTSLDKALGN